ncbi:MAG: hypothetical protein COU08_02865 [Candidatus Harrisonbacteria bacterium CG10_big_fil_rev_8_21_14_0_10_42_17]|uniref:Uncharacterized protein n=1 Tax=Candidatus Harrisonbacteria bacterium CG10_big_fil_rev_8_21_14_0_10_42_17 TaxID=1974584 RepID=A0A2M6WHT3_9BACT|nr:MAG: hypothetical protein COU08_02865 [Candidatus Harrisonbacteria bacterium CG10_big_fil_rev_8_21_14_0_10_42_17]
MNSMEKKQSSQLEKRVMRRVYFFWCYKKVSGSKMIRLATLATVTAVISAQISLSYVLANMRRMDLDLSSILKYFLNASLQTEGMMQILIGLVAILTAVFIWDMTMGVGRLAKSMANKAVTLRGARRF